MKNILVLLGPNLNMLGRREPELYGHETLAGIEAMIRDKANEYGFAIDFRQSNHEGELVSWIQEELDNADAIIINAGAYTHTSLAIHDALKMFAGPVIEVHHSDPSKRESFRHFSYIEPLAARIIKGRGPQGYLEGLEFLKKRSK